MKKFYLFFLGVFIWSSFGFTKTLIFSDIDDTLRITHVRNPLTRIGRVGAPLSCSLLNQTTKIVFSDMPLLYQTMKQTLSNEGQLDNVEIHYVSNFPKFLNTFVTCDPQSFLTAFEFPQNSLHLRDSLSTDLQVQRKNKVDAISARIDAALAHPADHRVLQIVLIGDNGEDDPNTFNIIAQKYRNKDVRFTQFIRHIYGQGTPLIQSAHSNINQIPFVLAGEIALNLIEKKWLDLRSSFITAETLHEYFSRNSVLLNSTNLFPKWYDCSHHELDRALKSSTYNEINPEALNTIEQTIQKVCSRKGSL